MGTFDSSKCVNKWGTIRTNGDSDVVDKWGTIRGAAQFDASSVVDTYGNLGTLAATGPWEAQLGTAETISTHLGTISTNYNASTSPPLFSNFASAGVTGYMSGVISGIGTWTIQGGTQTIGGVSYAGGGLIIATGANTHTGPITVQAGANLQLGADASNTTTKAGGVVNIAAGATVTQFSSHPNATFVTQALNNTSGTYNLKGSGVCGTGGLLRSTTVTNNGTINLDKVNWANQSTWGGTGTVNVADGATVTGVTSVPSATNTFNINGCGWCDSTGAQIGAIYMTVGPSAWGSPINLQSASCIKSAPNITTTFNGALSGSAPLSLGVNGTPASNTSTIMQMAGTGSTYSGTITVDRLNFQPQGTSLQNAAVVLTGGSCITFSSATIGSLSSSDPTTRLLGNDFSSNIIKNNGITTFAGQLLWNGGSNTANYYLNGGAANQLTLTNTGNTANIYARDGSKVILQGATFTGTNGQARISNGSTISAGTSTTASVMYLSIDATSALDVFASGSGVGKLTVGAVGILVATGWKVNVKDALAPGTYTILQKPNTAAITLPTLGINNSGGTVTFSQTGNLLQMTVA